MTTHPMPGAAQPGAVPAAEEGAHALASGLMLFASVLMMLGGLLGIFSGIAAIANDQLFVVTPQYVFQYDITGWGWIHLILGVVIALAGFALLSGATWARAVGVVLAGLSLIANFMFLPYYPLWSVVVIALDAFIIWALCVGPGRAEA